MRIATVGLLGAVSVIWAGLALGRGSVAQLPLLVAALAFVAAGVFRLTLSTRMVRQRSETRHRRSAPSRAAWEALAALCTILLEALHPNRPWHTGILVVLVTTYVWAVHLAELPSATGHLRREARLAIWAFPMVVILTGIAMLPAPYAGGSAAWLTVLAAGAAIVAGALAIPV
jgi:hypothetical protein